MCDLSYSFSPSHILFSSFIFEHKRLWIFFLLCISSEFPKCPCIKGLATSSDIIGRCFNLLVGRPNERELSGWKGYGDPGLSLSVTMNWALSSIMGSFHDALPYCWTRVHRTKWPWTEISEYLSQNNFSLHYLPRHLVTVFEWELIPLLPYSSACTSKPQFAKHLHKQFFSVRFYTSSTSKK